MKADDRKARAELIALLTDEPGRLAKYRMLGARFKLACIVLSSIAACIALFHPELATAAAAFFGIAGGTCMGIYLAYDTSLLTWPIVRPLLNEEAVRELVASAREPHLR